MSLFQFNWEDNKGLDLYIKEWERRIEKQTFNPAILELGMALYSAFSELRTILKIMKEGKPGKEHSYYQFHFELFSHNHFLSIAVNRVLMILKLSFPEERKIIDGKYEKLIKQVNSYRNNLEHQTNIGKGKNAPAFFNNLSGNGYESQDNTLPYKEIEKILNEVMASLEKCSV